MDPPPLERGQDVFYEPVLRDGDELSHQVASHDVGLEATGGLRSLQDVLYMHRTDDLVYVLALEERVTSIIPHDRHPCKLAEGRL